jgi:hypothetical protein
VNAFARINIPFGAALTKPAALPEGARRSLDDPFAEKPTPYKAYAFAFVVGVLVVAWFLGRLDGFLPEGARSTAVLHKPSASAPTTAPTVSVVPSAHR